MNRKIDIYKAREREREGGEGEREGERVGYVDKVRLSHILNPIGNL